MKKPTKKTVLIVSAILLPLTAAAVAIPKLITRRRQSGWRRAA